MKKAQYQVYEGFPLSDQAPPYSQRIDKWWRHWGGPFETIEDAKRSIPKKKGKNQSFKIFKCELVFSKP